VSAYQIVARAEMAPSPWNAFVDASDEAWLWHRFETQRALETWGQADISFDVVDRARDAALCAVVPLSLHASRRAPWIGGSLVDSLGGPAVDHTLEPAARAQVLEAIREGVRARAARHRASEIRMSLSPMAPAQRQGDGTAAHVLHALGATHIEARTRVVALDTSGQWRGGLQKRARGAIARARQSQVEVRPATADDLDVYYDLHLATYGRTGASPHPRAYFAAIWRDFLAAGLARVFVAERERQPVAAANVGVYKHAAVYWTGASSDEGLKTQANSLLQMAVMEHLALSGVTHYELGEAFPDTTEGKLRGLDDFKRSFGGDLRPLPRGVLVVRPISRALQTVARRVFAG
jgi:hypothetical protein